MIETATPTTPAERDKAVEVAIKSIEKSYGKGSVMLMSDKAADGIDIIPTGIPSIDNDVLGVGGMPRGRIVEMYGEAGGGKTTLALQLVGQAQKAGGKAAYIDAEYALDPAWAIINGVDVDSLLISQPDYGEMGLDIAQTLIETNAVDIIVVDSVASLVPKTELEGSIGDAHVGLAARMMSQALRMLNAKVAKANCILLFINQLRDKIGISYGDPSTTPGGRALKFYSSVRLDVRRIGAVKKGDEVIGNKTKIKCSKNKVAPPFREAEINLLYGVGFDVIGNMVDKAVERGTIEKSGAWYSYKGDRWQGKDAVVDLLKGNSQLLEEIRLGAAA